MSSIYLYIIYIKAMVQGFGSGAPWGQIWKWRAMAVFVSIVRTFILLRLSFLYAIVHTNHLFCEEEREYSDGTAKESSGGWKGVRELVGSASLSRRAEASRPSGIARYSMESEDSPRFLRRGRSEIGWNTDPPSLYRDGGFIFFKGSLITMASVFPYRLAAILIRSAVSQTEPQSVASFDLVSNIRKVGTPCLAY